MAWQDEFDGPALDGLKWDYRTGVRYWSTQLPENVSVGGGLLNLHLRKETVGSTDYTAGGVISRDLFRYGFYEARMKVPPGAGWHTSFWMMRANRPPTATVAIELDVIENDSVDLTEYSVNTHRHLPTPHTTFGNKAIATPPLDAEFHVFGCEFTPSVIRYFFDGALVQTVDATRFAHDDLNIWLTSIAAPLGGTTRVDDSRVPAVAQYDWVRYYEPFPAPGVAITSPSAPAVMLAAVGDALHLEAAVTAQTGSPTVAWACVEGPGTVSFSDPSAARTTASFSAAGNYLLECVASNEGGTATDRLNVGVAAPAVLALRQGSDGYAHTATLIRADHTDWNAGARDQLIVGRTTGPLRALFSFDLSPLPAGSTLHQATLDLTTLAGTGNIGSLELRRLTATPVEGSGTADGSEGSNPGTGTGATWLTRTGGSTPTDLWASPGGDFDPGILTVTAGYDATLVGVVRRLPDSPAFRAAVLAAHAAGQPLDLVLGTASEANATGYTRLHSDDALIELDRPALRLTFTGNQLPAVNPGPPPAPTAGVEVALLGSAAGAASVLWSCAEGPGAVTFANPTSVATSVSFPSPGTYRLVLAASNPQGTTEREVDITVSPNPATFAGWLAITWPGVVDHGIIGPTADPDHDGRANLVEWALGLDGRRPDAFEASVHRLGEVVEITFTRRRTAPGELIAQVEWSDTLAGDWTADGVSMDPPVALGEATASVRATLPAGPGGHRFVRIRFTRP